MKAQKTRFPFFLTKRPFLTWRWFLALIGFLCACHPTVSNTENLSFTTIEKMDNQAQSAQTYYPSSKPSIFLVTQLSEVSLVSQWLNSETVNRLQNLDYNQTFAIVAFQGHFYSGWGSYQVEITQINLTDNFLSVTALFVEPSPTQVVIDASANPYHVVAVQRPSNATSFKGANLVVNEQIVASTP